MDIDLGTLPQRCIAIALNRVETEKNCQRKDHQLGVEEDENAGVVQAPLAVEAARCFNHAPEGGEYGKKLPVGCVEVSGVGKSGQAHARGHCAEREDEAAQQRALPQAERVRAGKHHTITVDALSYFAASSIARRDSA